MSIVGSIENVLTQGQASAQRAALFTSALGAHFPTAAFVGCALQEGDDIFLSAIDESGRGFSKGEEYLRQRVQAAAPGDVPVPGIRLLETAISCGEKPRGILAVGLRGQADDDSLQRQLEDWGGCLGVCLALEQERALRQRLESKHREGQFLADVGQISRPIVHELYNLLNTLSLQVEVLKMKFPGDRIDAELAMFKKQVNEMVKVLKAFRSYRQNQPVRAEAIDFHRILRDTVATLRRESRLPEKIQLDLAPRPVHVKGSPADAERLLRFLFVNVDAKQPMRIDTATSGGKVTMTVEGVLENPSAELRQAFEAPGGNLCAALELAAFKMLLESFHGKVTAEPLPERGQRAIVELRTVETT